MDVVRALLMTALASAAVAGCEERRDATGAAPNADRWIGRWHGPEGTYLEIAGENGTYAITIRDLDAARTFNGFATGDHILFERDGATESLRATDGEATGMKWLAEKSDCLTVKAGEGYCRD